MGTRVAAWLAWSLWVSTVALMALTAVFRTLYPLPEAATRGADLAVSILFIATFPTVGALIASRRPENPIGWVFCAMSLVTTIAVLLGHYAEYSLVVERGAFPRAQTAAWAENWIWPVALSPVGFFLLLFPDGHPPSRRWRLVAWLLAAALAGWFVSQAFVPGPLVNAGYESVRNPYGVEALGDVLKVLGSVSGFLLLGSVLASAISLLIRFRRSGGDERRQLEWVAYAGALVMLVLVIQLGVETSAPQNEALVEVFNLILTVSLCCVPVSAAIAIFKYRLYDIDILINRTLVYGALTASLALVYFGGVVSLQYALRNLTGQESQLAVVASTLAIAALFVPLRRRAQGFVDRRFYRKKYDAVKTLEEFSYKLREETDLDALNDDLVGVVRETMQPAYVSLWLRPDTSLNEGETSGG
jgi:hypothetical protein